MLEGREAVLDGGGEMLLETMGGLIEAFFGSWGGDEVWEDEKMLSNKVERYPFREKAHGMQDASFLDLLVVHEMLLHHLVLRSLQVLKDFRPCLPPLKRPFSADSVIVPCYQQTPRLLSRQRGSSRTRS